MPIVSKSGYIIKDIYADLQSSMASNNFVRVCHLTAELICSNELKPMVSWLISLLSNSYVGTNAFLLHFLNDKLTILSDEGFKWKKETVKMSVCEMFLILTKETMNPTVFFKPDGFTKEVKQFIETLYFSPSKGFIELRDNMGYVVENEIFDVVTYLYEYMLKNDIKSVYKIMYFILQKKSVDECETLDIVQSVKRSKNDPVWLLWKVLFIYAARPPTNANTQTYIENAFNIFKFDYNRKNREERLNLLFVGYLVCVRRKGISYQDTYDDFIHKASSKINIVYDEIMEKENQQKTMAKAREQKEKKHRQEEKKKIKEDKVKSSLSPEEQQALAEKMKYMFVITYKKHKEPIYKPYQVAETSYKVLEVSSMTDKGSHGQDLNLVKM